MHAALMSVALLAAPAFAGEPSLSLAQPVATGHVPALASSEATLTPATDAPRRWALGFAMGGAVWGTPSGISGTMQVLPFEARHFGPKGRHSVDIQVDWARSLLSVAAAGVQAGGGIAYHLRLPASGSTSFAVAPGLRVAGGSLGWNTLSFESVGEVQFTGSYEVAVPIRLGFDVPSRSGHMDYGIYLRPELGVLGLVGTFDDAQSGQFSQLNGGQVFGGIGAEVSFTWNLNRH